MFITLDGFSGAGKTTQNLILADRLNLETVRYVEVALAIYHATVDIIGEPNRHDRHVLSLDSSISSYHSNPMIARSVCDHFWECLFSSFYHDELDIDRALEYFRAGLRYGNRAEPTLSVYIVVPSYTAKKRVARREYGTELCIPEIKDKGDEAFRKFCDFLEAEIPYFHRVDGTVSVEEVTEQILNLVEDVNV